MQDEIKVETQESESTDGMQAELDDALEKSEAESKKDPQIEIDALKSQLKESSDQYVRLRADFENFRRRAAKEKTELADVVTQNLITDLLPVVDGFSRALDVESKDLEAFKKGFEMLAVQFIEILKKNGLDAVASDRGTDFNPEFHQAVQRVADDEIEEGKIAQELQKGFIVKGRVIRPSMVAVSGS